MAKNKLTLTSNKLFTVFFASIILTSCMSDIKRDKTKTNTDLTTATDTNPVENFNLGSSSKNAAITTKPSYGNSIKNKKVADTTSSDPQLAKYMQINDKVYHNSHDDLAFAKYFLKHGDTEILILDKTPIKNITAGNIDLEKFSAKAYSKKASYSGLANAKIENSATTTFYEGGADNTKSVYSKVVSFKDLKPAHKAGTFKLTFETATKIKIVIDGIEFTETMAGDNKLAYRFPDRITVPQNSPKKFIDALGIKYKNSSTTAGAKVESFTAFRPKSFEKTHSGVDKGHFLNRQGAELRATKTYIPDSFKEGLTLNIEKSIAIKDHPAYFFNAAISYLALDGEGDAGRVAFKISFVKDYFGTGLEVIDKAPTAVSIEGFDYLATLLTFALVSNKVTLGE